MKLEKNLNFDEFATQSYDEWKAAAEISLKGGSFEKLVGKTYEGFDINPLHTASDIETLSTPVESAPGFYPFLRGGDALGAKRGWEICQEFFYGSPEEMNKALKYDLERGQNSICILLDEAARRSYNPESAADSIGVGGVAARNIDAFEKLFDNIDLKKYPIHIKGGFASIQAFALFIAYCEKNGVDTTALSGAVRIDPIGSLAEFGEYPVQAAQSFDALASLFEWAQGKAPNFKLISINLSPLRDAGADAASEIAFALSAATEYVRAMTDRGVDVDRVCNKIMFEFSAGGNFFVEIAKFRAARALWARVAKRFGAKTQNVAFAARTSRLTLTEKSPYTNMLRHATQALSAIIGGVEILSVSAYDAAAPGEPSEFSRRTARNLQLVLREEAHMSEVVDPGGGSYALEKLTDDIGAAIWGRFRQIESDGGALKALEKGSVQKEVSNTAEKRLKNLATGKDALVGINKYVYLDEKKIEKKPLKSISKEIFENIEKTRDVKAVSAIKAVSNGAFDDLIKAARKGASLGDLSEMLYKRENKTTVKPILKIALSQPFETMRKNALSYKETNGSFPQIYLARFGSLKQFKARADFAADFFAAGGFEYVAGGPFESLEDAARAIIEGNRAIVVLCSTDENYAEIAAPLARLVKRGKPLTKMILAGYPKNLTDELKAAGFDEFIHIKADAVDILSRLQKDLGVI